ncbi:MAG: dihydrolipoyl dehydrogenase [Actinomycetota bacterium]|nr:dihydrolipoyl dehydrogenase [Actinomycetota bacterium]
MTSNDFDLVVIGGGPAGYAAAFTAVASDLNVALIERDRIGGTCLHRGCIPAKELLETAAVHRTVTQAGEFGINTNEPVVDFSAAQARKQAVVDRLFKGITHLVASKDINVFEGTGKLAGDRNVEVTFNDGNKQLLTGHFVVVAAGSQPKTLPGFDIDGDTVLASDELLELKSLPNSAAIIGGGATGCEFASMLSDLGTQVTILEATEGLVPGTDIDIAKSLERSFKKRGIDVVTGVSADRHSPHQEGTVVHLTDETELDVEKVIVCVGRRPYTDHLGLADTAIRLDDDGFVVVDELCRTNCEGVYAIGDVISTPQLAHVGFAEAMVAVRDILGENPKPTNYSRVAWAIYCHPEIAYAGMTEEQATHAGYDVVTTQHRFAGNARALIHNETEGIVKLVAERRSDGTAGQLLGVHLIGPRATEQLSQGYLAINWEIEIDEIAEFIQPHPTLSELFGEAVLEMAGRTLHG